VAALVKPVNKKSPVIDIDLIVRKKYRAKIYHHEKYLSIYQYFFKRNSRDTIELRVGCCEAV